MVANPSMITAYKAGVPVNGQPFPDGSRIVKLQWKPKKSTEAQLSPPAGFRKSLAVLFHDRHRARSTRIPSCERLAQNNNVYYSTRH
ncbi:MAG: cytochrome P460 family protein [Candidatus Sulfotelmatobacter sp.]